MKNMPNLIKNGGVLVRFLPVIMKTNVEKEASGMKANSSVGY